VPSFLHHLVEYCFRMLLCVNANHTAKSPLLFVMRFRILAVKTELSSDNTPFFFYCTENAQGVNQMAHGSFACKGMLSLPTP